MTQEELEHPPYELCGTIRALTHRQLYLRLNGERQLTALDNRKEALLQFCREQGIHLFLQPSRNEIYDLTDSTVYELHAEKMSLTPLTDEIVGGEVTFISVERTAGTQERGFYRERWDVAPDTRQRHQEMLDQTEIDSHVG